MEFNEKLQELRKGKKLTQEELAQDLFVSRTAISKWESGRGYPSIDSLKEISRYFSVSIDELIGLKRSFPRRKRKSRNMPAEPLRSYAAHWIYLQEFCCLCLCLETVRIPRRLCPCLG